MSTNDVTEAFEEISHQLSEVPPQEDVLPEYLTTRQIAAALRTTPSHLSRIKSEHDDFPDPVARVATGYVYSRDDVKAWAFAHNRAFGRETPLPSGAMDREGIAQFWGVTPSRVSQIQSENDDFPRPVGTVEGRRFYDPNAVLNWGIEHGREPVEPVLW